jgi:hypothetical protein
MDNAYVKLYLYDSVIRPNYIWQNVCIYKKNFVVLVRKRTISTERPPHVDEVSANFCG